MATEGTASDAAQYLGLGWKVSPYLELRPGTTTVLADVKGQGAIEHLWMTDNTPCARWLILRIYFDGQSRPAVEAPTSDFFANAYYQEHRQLSSLAMCMDPARGMNCYFEMPYCTGFRVEIENIGFKLCRLYYQIDCEEKKIPEDSLYFHAQFRRTNPPAL